MKKTEHKTTATLAPLAYCAGEPAGVGVDLAVELAHHEARKDVVLVGCRRTLLARAESMERPLSCLDYPDDAASIVSLAPGQLYIVDRPCPLAVRPGQPLPENAAWILENLDAAWRGIGRGRFAGLVTGPVDKSVVMRSGADFSGHTEYLARLDGDRRAVMLLAADRIKVALATTHTPISDVAGELVRKIASGEFEASVRTLVDGLRGLYGIERPRLAVCGLNPHAGEGGRLGTEERQWMTPALDRLRADPSVDAELIGPVSADTAFTPPQLERLDAHLSMYHDQGLTAIKSLAFGQIVNTTLGLSFVRTSVDHGVAYDRAGTGGARPGSLFRAIAEASRMASVRAQLT